MKSYAENFLILKICIKKAPVVKLFSNFIFISKLFSFLIKEEKKFPVAFLLLANSERQFKAQGPYKTIMISLFATVCTFKSRTHAIYFDLKVD